MVKKHEASDYIIKDVSINDLELDPMNPRQEIPSDELVDSIKEKYDHDKSLITWYDNGKYWISDGWERYQAGFQAGLTKFPCRVYKDHIKALKAAKQASIVNPWTDFQNYTHYKNFYDTCIESGMTHHEAIKRTIKDNPINEKVLLRYLNIFDLPSPVLSLMKEERNICEKEMKKLQKYDNMIKLRHKKLGIKITHSMALKLKGFPHDTICEIAVDVLGMNSRDALKAIERISQNPDKDPHEIIKKIEKGYETDRILHVGDFIFKDPNLKQTIVEYVASRFISTKTFIKELIERWLLSTGKHSILIHAPAQGENKKIKEISFKRGNYSINVLQVSGTPIISIEGTPSTHFSYSEIVQRAWNRYSSLPQYLKNFLNSLRIEFDDNNQIDIKKTQEYILQQKIVDELLKENKDLYKKIEEKNIKIEKLKEFQKDKCIENSK
ncbi:MAG: hypothetical protein CEE43_13775 [Promethearchaeota archaeon Loki_b32]|nr:MAG: hypothetical protein CEE43_13775 [Candidatus Lokiarchaeota archaeon Loki_b32]